MKQIFAVLFFLTSCGSAKDNSEQELLVGKWTLVDMPDVARERSGVTAATLEFSPDGRMTRWTPSMGSVTFAYKLDNRTIGISADGGKWEDTLAIRRLTKTALELYDGNNLMTLERIAE